MRLVVSWIQHLNGTCIILSRHPLHTANTAHRPHLSENITDGARGDEWRAQYWGPADPTKPVFVRQVAAYQHCCTGAPEFVLLSQATGATLLKVNKQNPLTGQSMLPQQQGDATKFNEGSAMVTEPFVVVIDGYRSDAPRYLGTHFYALRGRDGAIIPNTFIIPMDYVTPYYKGCLDPYNYPGCTSARPPASMHSVHASARVTVCWRAFSFFYIFIASAHRANSASQTPTATSRTTSST